MKVKHLFYMAICWLMISCGQNSATQTSTEKKGFSVCSDNCEAKSKSTNISCKLTSPELQKRRETVLESLKKQIIDKKELPDGYAFKFPGNDKMINELTEFIKTERVCCNFFTFNLSMSGDTTEVWMELKGPKGTKEMIGAELGI
jgi:hypothetical protein